MSMIVIVWPINSNHCRWCTCLSCK